MKSFGEQNSIELSHHLLSDDMPDDMSDDMNNGMLYFRIYGCSFSNCNALGKLIRKHSLKYFFSMRTLS